MLTGNISAQAIALLSAPFITRLYSPGDFGTMALVYSYIGILSAVSCLRYESAIVIEKNDNKALGLLVLCIAVTTVFSLMLFAGALLGRDRIPAMLNISQVKNIIWLIPAGVFLHSLYQPFVFWNTRIKNFFLIAVCRICDMTFSSIVKILLGFVLGSSALFLIAGNILGAIVGILVLVSLFLKTSSINLRVAVQKKGLFDLARRYSQFPKYHALTGLLGSVSQNLPVLLFAWFFSPQIAGFYGLANSILRKPINLMSESLTKVFLQKASDAHARGHNLTRYLKKTTMVLTAIGVVPFAVLLFAGQYIFTLIFGEEWSTAGFYAQLLAPWLFFGFINPPSTQILIVKQMLKFSFYFNLCNTLLRIFIIVLFSLLFSEPWIIIASFSAAGVMSNVYYITFAFSKAGEQ
jgi:O-antigen/teichoic acid export membrane protein